MRMLFADRLKVLYNPPFSTRRLCSSSRPKPACPVVQPVFLTVRLLRQLATASGEKRGHPNQY